MSANPVTIDGFVKDGYENVREAFQRLVDSGAETGAGLSVWRTGGRSCG